MAKRRLFRFPTSDKDLLKLFRLLADLSDLADGDDDVDEGDALTRRWLRAQLAAGATPDAVALAAAAEGEGPGASDDLTGLAAPTGGDTVPLTWRAVARALHEAEVAGRLTAVGVTEALHGLGLRRAPELEAQAGCLAFEGDGERVGVRLLQLGSIRAAEVAVATRGKKKGKRTPAAEGPLTAGAAGTYVAGSVIGQAAWDDIVDAFGDTLERAQAALQAAGAGSAVPHIPVTFDTFKAFVATGKDEEDQAEDDAELAEIGALQAQIRDAWTALHAAGRAPSGVVLQYDGPDGAGKTSSSKYVPAALLAAEDDLRALPAFADAAGPVWRTRTEIFKAPTDADKAAMAADAGAPFGLPTWLARHVTRGMPGPREILIKDRYQPGDFVYVGEHTPERCARMAAENARYEALLAERNVLVFQAILYADRDKQAKTFGKRMARGALVDALVGELARRDTLTPAVDAELQAVKDKVQNADFVGLQRFESVLPLYRQIAEAMGVPVIDATDRHAARLDLLERFLAVLRAW